MMTSEERARKFWHDWYNGDAPGDLKMGDAMVGDDDVAELIALIDAVREEEREAAATYLLDRADQYKTTLSCWVAVSDCAEAVARGEAVINVAKVVSEAIEWCVANSVAHPLGLDFTREVVKKVAMKIAKRGARR